MTGRNAPIIVIALMVASLVLVGLWMNLVLREGPLVHASIQVGLLLVYLIVGLVWMRQGKPASA